MKILHLAAGNRWTGAAAPAFAEVEALREVGHDAHYAYVGGYKLESRLRNHPFAYPLLDRAQNPVSFRRSVRAIRELLVGLQIEVVHAHLTWDHWLARFAVRGTNVRLARTFHSRRTLRRDPLTSSLLRKTDAVFIINEAFSNARALQGKRVTFTPPPLDTRLFRPEGDTVRHRYGIDPSTPLITVIGKLARQRGFEEALETFALLHRVDPRTRLMIIGHGDHRAFLERLAADLAVSGAVLWAGYHEDDLPEHYRAADVLLFTAAGSDEGHRAIIEALGCGLPPAAFPLDGVHALLGPLAKRLAAKACTPQALAATVQATLTAQRASLVQAVLSRATEFEFGLAAERLIDGYMA